MTITLPETADTPCSTEDMERIRLSLNGAYPNREARCFDYLLRAIDAAEEKAAHAEQIGDARDHSFG